MIVDVSVYQGEINWAAIKADAIQLAIIKATEGVGYEDARFAQNWAGAAAAGVPRGAYHFAHPDLGNSAPNEAAYFLSVVRARGLKANDVLAEDYEVPGGGAAWSLAFLDYVLAQTSIRPKFYSNYSGCSRVASDVRMSDYPLWLAYPGDGLHLPPVPAPWGAIQLWQYAVGTVPGIAGNVDEDVSVGIFGPGTGSVVGEDMNPTQIALLFEMLYQLLNLLTKGTDAFPVIPDAGVSTPYAGTIKLPTTADLAAAIAALKSGGTTTDTAAILSAIADLKTHPSFDPNDALMLGIVQKLEAAVQKSGTDLQGA